MHIPALKERIPFAQWSSVNAKTWTALLKQFMKDMRQVDAVTVAEAYPVHVNAVDASPWTLRIMAMGVHDHVTLVHDDALLDGGLKEKYDDFLIEASEVRYKPAYHSKWLPHEVLHRLGKCFWHPEMTRFDFYLSARLNEWLPVTVWWGIEQALRFQGGMHQRHSPEHENKLWRSNQSSQLFPEATTIWMRGINHMSIEWAAICKEEHTRIPVPTQHVVPDATLDASSDAMKYAFEHHGRMLSPETKRLFSQKTPNTDFFDRIDKYKNHIRKLAERLLFEPFELRPAPRHTRTTQATFVLGTHAQLRTPKPQQIKALLSHLFELAPLSTTWLKLSQPEELLISFLRSDLFWAPLPLEVRFLTWIQQCPVSLWNNQLKVDKAPALSRTPSTAFIKNVFWHLWTLERRIQTTKPSPSFEWLHDEVPAPSLWVNPTLSYLPFPCSVNALFDALEQGHLPNVRPLQNHVIVYTFNGELHVQEISRHRSKTIVKLMQHKERFYQHISQKENVLSSKELSWASGLGLLRQGLLRQGLIRKSAP